MAGFIVLVTFVLLFVAFGSFVLPAKALVMNVLSLSAAFGAMVWIFQDGHLSGLLDFTPAGFLDATNPVLLFAVLFGLSMDYEVFLLSRIREEYDRTGDNTQAVALGLQRTGGIITSAALLLIIVVAAFSTSGIVFVKMIGVGLVIAIALDATIVRALLVPATMRLLGRANWWAPKPLVRWWERYGFRETSEAQASGLEPEQLPVGRVGRGGRPGGRGGGRCGPARTRTPPARPGSRPRSTASRSRCPPATAARTTRTAGRAPRGTRPAGSAATPRRRAATRAGGWRSTRRPRRRGACSTVPSTRTCRSIACHGKTSAQCGFAARSSALRDCWLV